MNQHSGSTNIACLVLVASLIGLGMGVLALDKLISSSKQYFHKMECVTGGEATPNKPRD